MTTSPFIFLLAEKHVVRGCEFRNLRAGSNIVTLLFPFLIHPFRKLSPS
jgi:hypothetical protein